MRADADPRPLSHENPGDHGHAALQGGAVFLREGVRPIAFDIDGADDLPPCTVQVKDYDLRAGAPVVKRGS
jgi:hypothetical protein